MSIFRSLMVKSLLPSNYKLLSYIQSTGTQYIDTLCSIKNNTELYIDGYYTAFVDGSGHGVFGGKTGRFHVGTQQTTRIDAGIYNQQGIILFTITDRAIMSLRNGTGFFINDTKHVNTTVGFSSSRNIYLFKINTSETAYYNAYAKFVMYKSQIYEGDILVRDFYPVIEISSGSVGLYDLVNERFYGSVTSNNFIAGPEA